MTGIRVYLLARALNVSADSVMTAATRLGYDVRNQLSTLDDVCRADIETYLRRSPPDDELGVPSNLRPRRPGPGGAACQLRPPTSDR